MSQESLDHHEVDVARVGRVRLPRLRSVASVTTVGLLLGAAAVPVFADSPRGARLRPRRRARRGCARRTAAVHDPSLPPATGSGPAEPEAPSAPRRRARRSRRRRPERVAAGHRAGAGAAAAGGGRGGAECGRARPRRRVVRADAGDGGGAEPGRRVGRRPRPRNRPDGCRGVRADRRRGIRADRRRGIRADRRRGIRVRPPPRRPPRPPPRNPLPTAAEESAPTAAEESAPTAPRSPHRPRPRNPPRPPPRRPRRPPPRSPPRPPPRNRPTAADEPTADHRVVTDDDHRRPGRRARHPRRLRRVRRLGPRHELHVERHEEQPVGRGRVRPRRGVELRPGRRDAGARALRRGVGQRVDPGDHGRRPDHGDRGPARRADGQHVQQPQHAHGHLGRAGRRRGPGQPLRRLVPGGTRYGPVGAHVSVGYTVDDPFGAPSKPAGEYDSDLDGFKDGDMAESPEVGGRWGQNPAHSAPSAR